MYQANPPPALVQTIAASQVSHRGRLELLGVNLAGAEFNPGKLPGVEGRDYTYPTPKEMDYYAAQGLNVIRLPVLWERVQPTRDGPLSPSELGHIAAVVRQARDRRMKVAIDIHDYGSGYGHAVGTPATPDSAFADLWGKLARRFAGDRNVIFGLMNEPHVENPAGWLPAVNAAIAAIRSAGATGQEILVPGAGWDGAWTWISSGNAATLGEGVKDPAGNFAFEVHQYLDPDGSGTHSTVASATIGSERLMAVTAWAERAGYRLFLGEFGVASDPASLLAMKTMLTYMSAHSRVWQGGTYWAGGAWWNDYPFSIEPSNGRSKPQMGVLRAFAAEG